MGPRTQLDNVGPGVSQLILVLLTLTLSKESFLRDQTMKIVQI